MQSRGEPVSKPPHSLRGWKEHVIERNGGKGNIIAVLGGSPVNELSFGDRKSHPQVGTLPLDNAKIVLQSADIRTYRVRADRDSEVVDIGNRHTLGDRWVEAGYVKHKKKRRYRRALRGANRDRAESRRCALEYDTALAFGEERLDLCDQIGGDTPFSEDIGQLVCADIVKTTFDIQAES